MGAVAGRSSRVVLRNDAQIYFTTLQLQRDVAEIMKGWFEDGAPLGLTSGSFQHLLRLDSASNVDITALFELFDTDKNQKVDVFEILCAAILLAKGSLEEKIDAVFPVFDFSSSGSFAFDELNILLHSVCRGLAKVCQTPQISDEDLIAACRQMFDAHNLPYDKPITRDHIKRWIRNDVEATHFISSLQAVVPLPVVEAELAQREEAQAEAFAQLCGAAAAVPAEELPRSAALRRAFGEISEADLAGLLGVMPGPDGTVAPERFARAARAWNAFAYLDARAEGTLAASELQLLLRLREHEEPMEGVEERLRKVIAQDGLVSRDSWLTASLTEE